MYACMHVYEWMDGWMEKGSGRIDEWVDKMNTKISSGVIDANLQWDLNIYSKDHNRSLPASWTVFTGALCPLVLVFAWVTHQGGPRLSWTVVTNSAVVLSRGGGCLTRRTVVTRVTWAWQQNHQTRTHYVCVCVWLCVCLCVYACIDGWMATLLN